MRNKRICAVLLAAGLSAGMLFQLPSAFADTTASADIQVTHTLENRTQKTRAQANADASFILQEYMDGTYAEKVGDPVTVQCGKDGTASFKQNYDKEGVHYYRIAEVQGQKKGLVYDAMTADVTVTVTDTDGQLTASVQYPQDTEFNDVYQADPLFLVVSGQTAIDDVNATGKKLSDGEFTFELKRGGKVLDTAENKADGSVTFDAVKITEPGTYEYTVSEQTPTEDGMTCEDGEKTVTVKVEDAGGVLSVKN